MYFHKNVTAQIFKLVSQLPENEWIQRKAYSFLRFRFVDLTIAGNFTLEKIYTEFTKLIHFDYRSSYKKLRDHIYFPNFLGNLYAMAVFGLLNLAIAKNPAWQFSVYDDCLACPLTQVSENGFQLKAEYFLRDCSPLPI